MKVTDAMVRAVCDHLGFTDPSWPPDVRAALEMALGPLPEPEPGICVALDERVDADRYAVFRGNYDFVASFSTMGAAMREAEKLAGKDAECGIEHDGQGGKIARYTGERGTFYAADGNHVMVK